MDLDRDLDFDEIDLPPVDDGEPPWGGPPRRQPPAAVLPWLALLFGVVALKQLALLALPTLPSPMDTIGSVLLVLGLVVGGFALALLFARAHAADLRRGARR